MPMKPRRSVWPFASNQLPVPSALSLSDFGFQRTSCVFFAPWSIPANISEPSWTSPVAARSCWTIRSKLSAADTSRPIDIRVAIALM